MKFKNLLRGMSLLVLLVSLIPASSIAVAAPVKVPPVDMFQLPWDQGLAWYAIDGVDNGTKRPVSSSHNYKIGGAIDFAPRTDMKTGDDTSNIWVAAAAAGTVVEISSCHMKIAHSDGWISEYQFLGNIQVKLGDAVAQNQRLGIIADGVKYRYCLGYVEPNTPHLHFILRPSIIGATFAGWQVNYSSFWNSTTFTKDGTTVGLFKLLLNAPGSTPTSTSVPSTATPVPTGITPTPSSPYVSIELDPVSVGIGGTSSAAVRLNGVPAEGYTSTEFTCSYDVNSVEVSNIAVSELFGADPAVAINDPQDGTFIVAVAGSKGNKATTSGVAFTFNAKGLQAGESVIVCNARVNAGDDVLTELPAIGAVLTIVGDTPTPSFTSTPEASSTPIIVVTPTSPVDDWLTFTNSTYGFEFKYPPQGVIADGRTDNWAEIDLPFVPGTNLGHKYLEVVVVENADPCQSPLATQSMLETSETVVINGITFLKQTGQDGTAGHINKWAAYTTVRDIACVSLDFVLRAADPGVFTTPPPLYDEAAESAVFGQIVSTYTWLALVPTATQTSVPVESLTPTFTTTPITSPTFTPTATPDGSPAPTFTSTPVLSPTPSGQNGAVAGQVIASKPVIVNVYDASTILVATMETSPDGTFRLEVLPGTYTVVAIGHGFLRAQAEVTLTSGNTHILPPISLLAGDIDENNVIDQFDAMTIGMNYNMTTPDVADLNNDGIINVLDLERLAQNYRKTGPIVWE